MSDFSDFFETLWDKISSAADSVYESMISMFKKGAEKAAEVLDAFVKSFSENVDDILIAAATAGYETATSVDGDWTAKLSAAVEKAVETLGDSAASYAKTDIINAVQAVYTASKTASSTAETTTDETAA